MNKWALITGASSGIGAELARVYASHSHNLILVARRQDLLNELAEELRGKGTEVHVIAMDLALKKSARELFKERLLQLAVKFQFAVKEKRWKDALDAGLEIMEEFPNARMAQEVREHLEALRERAGLTVNIEVTARDGGATTSTDSRN